MMDPKVKIEIHFCSDISTYCISLVSFVLACVLIRSKIVIKQKEKYNFCLFFFSDNAPYIGVKGEGSDFLLVTDTVSTDNLIGTISVLAGAKKKVNYLNSNRNKGS